MLSEKSIEQIAGLLKVSSSDLKAKITSESEEEVSLPELKVFTAEEFDSRLRNEKNTSYQEGKVAQEEMLVKQAKKDLGYDFEGKSFESFIQYHDGRLKEKYSKDSGSRVKELESDIAKLNENHAATLQGLQDQNRSLSGQVLQMKVSNELLSSMPAETTIDKSDVISLFQLRHQVEEQEGRLVVKRNGETVKDETTASPLDVKDVFTQFITERGYVKADPGRGTGNETGGKSGYSGNSVSEFNDRWEKSGKKVGTPEYDSAYSNWRKQVTDVVL